jgi:hypothetical protein
MLTNLAFVNLDNFCELYALHATVRFVYNRHGQSFRSGSCVDAKKSLLPVQRLPFNVRIIPDLIKKKIAAV